MLTNQMACCVAVKRFIMSDHQNRNTLFVQRPETIHHYVRRSLVQIAVGSSATSSFGFDATARGDGHTLHLARGKQARRPIRYLTHPTVARASEARTFASPFIPAA